MHNGKKQGETFFLIREQFKEGGLKRVGKKYTKGVN